MAHGRGRTAALVVAGVVAGGVIGLTGSALAQDDADRPETTQEDSEGGEESPTPPEEGLAPGGRGGPSGLEGRGRPGGHGGPDCDEDGPAGQHDGENQDGEQNAEGESGA